MKDGDLGQGGSNVGSRKGLDMDIPCGFSQQVVCGIDVEFKRKRRAKEDGDVSLHTEHVWGHSDPILDTLFVRNLLDIKWKMVSRPTDTHA